MKCLIKQHYNMKQESSDWIEVKGNYTWFRYDLIKAFNKRTEEINMKEQTIKFRDPVVQCVVNKFVDRSDVGFAKYGKTLRDDKSDIFVWLNHLQEELMDATLYLQRLKEEVSTLREEKALLEELNASYADINDIDVIDAFEVRVKKNRSKTGSGRGDTHSFTIDEPIRFISDTTNSHLDLRAILCGK